MAKSCQNIQTLMKKKKIFKIEESTAFFENTYSSTQLANSCRWINTHCQITSMSSTDSGIITVNSNANSI